MKIDDPNDNQTEGIMSDISAPRYGFPQTAAFAATRACAERRARETAAADAADARSSSSSANLLHRLATLLTRAF